MEVSGVYIFSSDVLELQMFPSSQVVRSCSSWSAGQDLTEFSIQRALVATIEEAKHYVYIENQFFVSYVKGGSLQEQFEQAEVLNKFWICLESFYFDRHRSIRSIHTR